MEKKGRKYIYLSNVSIDGTVFQTQVLDWLHLYKKHQLEFELLHVFHVKELKRPANVKKQITYFKKNTILSSGFMFFFPSRNLLYIINVLEIFFRILRYIYKYDEVLIFSRALIGKEITLLRKIFPGKIVFFYDARGAGAEENKYDAIKHHDNSRRKYRIIADTYFLEFKTVLSADTVFVVSLVLEKYFKNMYGLNDKKFMLYPCLSDSSKFYFSPNLRMEVRSKLHISDDTKVFIYSGGVGPWHLSEKLISFFDQLLKHEKNVCMLYLTKDNTNIEKVIDKYPEVKTRFLSFSVQNKEVHKYLNAADYGLLFRENSIVNNVASPTKFAEYILCGLPVIISEGIGDYSDFTEENNLGVLLKESELRNFEMFDFNNFIRKSFDRTYISDIGLKHFSKESAINTIISELQY